MSLRGGKGRDRFALGPMGLQGFYRSVAEAEKAARRREVLRGQLHHIRRAFEVMQLDGVLCLEDQPTVFFKDYSVSVSRKEANLRQRQCWNQGSASLLVLQDPQRVHLYSAIATPSSDQAAGKLSDHIAWIESLERTADTLEAYRLAETLASGHFYREHWGKFDFRQAVDRQLVRDLGLVCEKLSGGGNPDELALVHAFLGRIIFVCYLVDRGIIDLGSLHFIRRKGVRNLRELLSAYPPDRAAALLDQLFRMLRREFNGSLFEYDAVEEREWLTEERVELLARFLAAEEMDTGQRALGFWAYDFSVIPVETISAIYEDFLKREAPDEKERKGAFFTPRHLAEMTVDEALRGMDGLLQKRFLDPACGSGVFLVILFNRIAEEWRLKNPKATVAARIDGLLDIMCRQLRGVDLNETACRIACFSLYVALLDQFEPRDLRQLKEDVHGNRREPLLPPILAYRKDRYGNTKTPVVFEGDFFDTSLPLGEPFDAIVGNPPWASRQKHGTELTEWMSAPDNPYLFDFKARKVRAQAAFFPAKQIAIPFLWKAALHLRSDGQAAILLPSQVLLNQTDMFQQEWFRRFTVARITHLADFRKFLFQKARRPCLILRFGVALPKDDSHIEYFVPKVSRRDPRNGLISVSADDRVWIGLAEVLEAACDGHAARLWKTRLWGTPRDVKLLNYLFSLPKLGHITGEPGDEGKRFTRGKGFKPWYQAAYDANPETYGLPKPIPGELDDLCLASLEPNHQLVLARGDCVTLGQRLARPGKKVEGLPSKKGFHRGLCRELVEGPLVLISKGFKNVKVAFADFDVFFPDPITGISGSKRDSELLAFLTVMVKSRLAAYFFFHTAASLGIERDEVRVHEIMDLPFPLPDKLPDPDRARQTLDTIASEFGKSRKHIASVVAKSESEDFTLAPHSLRDLRDQRADLAQRLQDRVEPLIHKYFGLTEDESAMIEDTVRILQNSATPSSPDVAIPTLDPPQDKDVDAYAATLCGTLNRWASADQGNPERAELFSAAFAHFPKRGLCMVVLQLSAETRAPRPTVPGSREEEAIARVAEAARDRSGPFTWTRGIIHSSDDAIRIIKPHLRGQWTRIAALNDADRIFGAIIGANCGRST